MIITYLSFISLGLPDSLLGTAWPAIHTELGLPLSLAGYAHMLSACGGVISSFLSSRVIKRFGTGPVTAVSVCMTAMGLWGYSISNDFFWMCLMTIPLGLGAGAVDAALNNFAALHYQVRHMNWLHCFWGIGAMAGPMIMSMFLEYTGGWRMGYRVIGALQTCLVIVLLASLPLWKKTGAVESDRESSEEKMGSVTQLLRLPGAKATLLAFFCYCAVETTTGLWGSSYLVAAKGMSAKTAAKWISLFYMGITLGRFLAGFITLRLSNKNMIRLGLGIISIGVVCLIFSSHPLVMLFGLICLGAGCAPVYPCLTHETPNRFGKQASQWFIGMQMVFAAIGSAVIPPLFGILAQHTTIALYPWFLLLFLMIMIVAVEQVYRCTSGMPRQENL